MLRRGGAAFAPVPPPRGRAALAHLCGIHREGVQSGRWSDAGCSPASSTGPAPIIKPSRAATVIKPSRPIPVATGLMVGRGTGETGVLLGRRALVAPVEAVAAATAIAAIIAVAAFDLVLASRPGDPGVLLDGRRPLIVAVPAEAVAAAIAAIEAVAALGFVLPGGRRPWPTARTDTRRSSFVGLEAPARTTLGTCAT